MRQLWVIHRGYGRIGLIRHFVPIALGFGVQVKWFGGGGLEFREIWVGLDRDKSIKWQVVRVVHQQWTLPDNALSRATLNKSHRRMYQSHRNQKLRITLKVEQREGNWWYSLILELTEMLLKLLVTLPFQPEPPHQPLNSWYYFCTAEASTPKPKTTNISKSRATGE